MIPALIDVGITVREMALWFAKKLFCVSRYVIYVLIE
jgi:hypothetical protein